MSDRLLIAYIDGRRVAIPAREVHSVIELDTVTPIPLAPVHVSGMSALRSRVLTVIDCRLALGLATGTDAGEEAIVVERAGYLDALRVDAAEDVCEQEGATTVPPGQLGRGWSQIACGMVETSAGPALLVALDALIAGPQAWAA